MTRLSPAYLVYPPLLERMRTLGGTWACYENQDLGHPELGHRCFLKYGPGCPCAEAPETHPDTEARIMWRYRRIGYVDLIRGIIIDHE